MPTSKEINEAIETLRSAGLSQPDAARLDEWNAARLKVVASGVTNREGLVDMFAGISDEMLLRAGIV